MRQGEWRIRCGKCPQLILHGRTELILGYGRSSHHMIPLYCALGMDVSRVWRTARPQDSQDQFAEVYSHDKLDELMLADMLNQLATDGMLPNPINVRWAISFLATGQLFCSKTLKNPILQ